MSSTAAVPAVKRKAQTVRAQRQRERYFTSQLPRMMYGFGDVKHPREDSVKVLEDMVVDYMVTMATRASRIAKKKNSFRVEDIMFLVRKDRKKYERVKELLQKRDEIQKARQPYEELNSTSKLAKSAAADQ